MITNNKASLMLTFIALAAPAAAPAIEGKNCSQTATALDVAINEFKLSLTKIKKNGSSHAEYMSQPDNYSIGISRSKNAIVVIFSPKDKNIIGGSMEYHINRNNLSIVKVIGHE